MAAEKTWWHRPAKILTAVTAFLVALAGFLTALAQVATFVAGDDSPPTVQGTLVAKPDAGTMFRGYILRNPGIEVREEPSSTAAVRGFLRHDTEVYIVCTDIGDPVTGPAPAGRPDIVTALWDKVRTDPDGPDLGFVPDAWVKTGTTAPQAAGCRA